MQIFMQIFTIYIFITKIFMKPIIKYYYLFSLFLTTINELFEQIITSI